MIKSVLRLILIIAICLTAAVDLSRAGTNADSAYTDRGKTDFDTFLKLLEPYGKWSKIDGKWAFTPNDHSAPYRNGRWIYTEFGWYWKGNAPHSWATEHYGFWKRGEDKVWSWYPGPYWLPQIVEFRATNLYIGWRTGEVDNDGNFTEAPIDRFSKPQEWTWVSLEHFANPITLATITGPDVAKAALEDSTDCRHTYLTYRIIDRPGPHPADFADLSKDGGMLAPTAMRDLAQQATAPKPDPNSPAAKMTGVTPLKLMGSSDGSDVDPSADKRKVKYWVTMSLPKPDAKPPPDAKADEIYLYRPDIFQDQDGIERRIMLFLDPNARVRLKDVLGSTPLNQMAVPSGPAVPATAAEPAANDPFSNPLNDGFRGSKGGSAPTNQASKPAAPTNAAPTGLKN